MSAHGRPEGRPARRRHVTPGRRFPRADASGSGRIAAISSWMMGRRHGRLLVFLCALLSWTVGGRPALAQGERPRVGVAFGGGSARGLAHVGIIAWFEEHHIPIDLAAGTSMGGLIGGGFAGGGAGGGGGAPGLWPPPGGLFWG